MGLTSFIKSFLIKQMLHLFVTLLYGEARDIILYTILNSVFLTSRHHVYLLSLLEFFKLLLRKDAMWFLYHILKSFTVRLTERVYPLLGKSLSARGIYVFNAGTCAFFPGKCTIC